MEAWSFDSRGPDETFEAGRELGRSIGAGGLAIALVGPLGAGKTVFVKGLAEGLGVDPRIVSSPTFVIAQQYVVPEGPEVLHHIDLYRLESEDELESIGFFDMLVPGAVLAAEWADRFPGALGRELLTIELEGPSMGTEAMGTEAMGTEAAGAEAPRKEALAAEVVGRGAEAPLEPGLVHGSAGTIRRARVLAAGEAAEGVLSDWAERLTRLRRLQASGPDAHVGESRPGTGSFVEMRLGLTIVLALGLWLSAQLDFSRQPLPICAALIPVGSDELGTSRATCLVSAVAFERDGADEGQRRGEGGGQEARVGEGEALGVRKSELEGIARLLVGHRIDLNRAGADLLETLPGIGHKRAAAILRARGERPFATVAEIERVPGIGPKTRARLEGWLRVEPAREAGTTRDG